MNNENLINQEKTFSIHNHKPDSTIDLQTVRNKIKRKMCEGNINEIPSNIIFRKVLRGLGNDVLTNT